MRAYGSGSVYLRGRVWWLRYRRGDEIKQESSHSRVREEAERLLATRLGTPLTESFYCPRCALSMVRVTRKAS